MCKADNTNVFDITPSTGKTVEDCTNIGAKLAIMATTINVNGEQYLVSLITRKDYYWGTVCTFPRLIERINGVKANYLSTSYRKELRKIDGMGAWTISMNRWRLMKENLFSSLEAFRYRSCDDLALVVKVGTPEYRALRRVEKILPNKISFYKEGTAFGMQPKGNVDYYWVYIK